MRACVIVLTVVTAASTAAAETDDARWYTVVRAGVQSASFRTEDSTERGSGPAVELDVGSAYRSGWEVSGILAYARFRSDFFDNIAMPPLQPDALSTDVTLAGRLAYRPIGLLSLGASAGATRHTLYAASFTSRDTLVHLAVDARVQVPVVGRFAFELCAQAALHEIQNSEGTQTALLLGVRYQ